MRFSQRPEGPLRRSSGVTGLFFRVTLLKTGSLSHVLPASTPAALPLSPTALTTYKSFFTFSLPFFFVLFLSHTFV
jgi:hypothetical protein